MELERQQEATGRPAAFLHPSACGPQADGTRFGNHLRLERERRCITLASIAAGTKIGLGLLQGLERGDVARWPSGIFRRAFIRAYAEAIGLDGDSITRQFLERFPDPAEQPQEAFVASLPADGRKAADGRLRLTLAGSGATFVGGRLLAAMRHRWAALAWDIGVLAVVGAMLFVTLQQFWMPLAVTMLAYYGGSILLLGNTPGVSLFAPPQTREGDG